MLEKKGSFSLKLDEFGMSVDVYLDYVKRQLKKDPNYIAHPFVRALLIAHSNAEKGKNGRYLGVSSPDDSNGCYTVVLEKNKKEFSILAIHNVGLGLEIPVEVGSYILLLSMRIEKLEGDEIEPEQAATIVNESIPILNMIIFNNDEWIPARNYCREVLKHDENYAEMIEVINSDIEWEDYPHTVRIIIAQTWILEKKTETFLNNKCNVIFTITEPTMDKKTFLDNILHTLCGEPSKYFDDKFKWTYFSDLHSSEKTKGKIGRNAPCNCGSGKKNKHCCKEKYV